MLDKIKVTIHTTINNSSSSNTCMVVVVHVVND